jgi:hypothetical protein
MVSNLVGCSDTNYFTLRFPYPVNGIVCQEMNKLTTSVHVKYCDLSYHWRYMAKMKNLD